MWRLFARPTWAVLPAALAFGAAAGAAGQTWTFDRDAAGKPAVGWSAVTGDWRVVADPSTPSKPNSLMQVSKEHTGNHFNVALAEGFEARDVEISLWFKAVAGKEDQGGGPVWRYQDVNNYYVARHNPLEDNYRVYKVVDGRRIQLGSADAKAAAGEWHSLRVTMAGDRIQCFLNGKSYLEARDATFPVAGRVGLWTKADAQTRFDDFRAAGKRGTG